MKNQTYTILRLYIHGDIENPYSHRILVLDGNHDYRKARMICDTLNENLIDMSTNSIPTVDGAYYVIKSNVTIKESKPVGRPTKPPTKTIRIPVHYEKQIRQLIDTLDGHNADAIELDLDQIELFTEVSE